MEMNHTEKDIFAVKQQLNSQYLKIAALEQQLNSQHSKIAALEQQLNSQLSEQLECIIRQQIIATQNTLTASQNTLPAKENQLTELYKLLEKERGGGIICNGFYIVT